MTASAIDQALAAMEAMPAPHFDIGRHGLHRCSWCYKPSISEDEPLQHRHNSDCPWRLLQEAAAALRVEREGWRLVTHVDMTDDGYGDVEVDQMYHWVSFGCYCSDAPEPCPSLYDDDEWTCPACGRTYRYEARLLVKGPTDA